MSKWKWGWVCAAALAAGQAHAATIISETAGAQDCCRVVTEYTSWIQSLAYSNVTISATLFNAGPVSTPAAGVFYLMNKVGSGTTAANEVVAPVTISGITSGTSTPTTIYTGLSLGAGSYFLVFNPTVGSLDWDDGITASVFTLGTGVTTTAFPDMNQGTIDPFPPATTFAFSGRAIYSVTGDLAGAVPEPSTAALLIGGLGVLGWLRLRRR